MFHNKITQIELDGTIINHINDLSQSLFKLDQLLSDEFFGRISRYCKLYHSSGLMLEYNMNIKPLVQNCIYRDKIHCIKWMNLQLYELFHVNDCMTFPRRPKSANTFQIVFWSRAIPNSATECSFNLFLFYLFNISISFLCNWI